MITNQRFSKFLSNLTLTPTQLQDGRTKYKGITKVLNRAYYGSTSDTDNTLLVGSWGKHTRISPPRDIDLLFVLPLATYQRFAKRTGNIQSQILNEVRNHLLTTYTTSSIKGDGPAVVINFTSYKVEVIPAARRQSR